MKVFPLWSLGVVLALAPELPAGSWESAYRAREWIGNEVPARILHIRNHASGPSRYPPEFHGLVITVADILWLYTEYDGTQNLSLRRGQVPEDDQELGALLQAVEPGLTSFTDVTARGRPAGLLPVTPPNGCFLACLVRWQELQQGAERPTRARLLACYGPGSASGHMLLEFWREGRRYIFDPDRPGGLVRVARRIGEDPLATAAVALEPRWHVRPVKAVPVELPAAIPESGVLVAREHTPAPSRT